MKYTLTEVQEIASASSVISLYCELLRQYNSGEYVDDFDPDKDGVYNIRKELDVLAKHGIDSSNIRCFYLEAYFEYLQSKNGGSSYTPSFEQKCLTEV